MYYSCYEKDHSIDWNDTVTCRARKKLKIASGSKTSNDIKLLADAVDSPV